MGFMSVYPWDEVVAQLKKSKRVVISSHNSPDGDALGSALGLARFLKGRGTEARVLYTGTLAKMYEWMSAPGEVEAYRPEVHDPVIAAADSIVVVDISNWGRLGPMYGPVMKSKAVRLDLDHHPGAVCPADFSINDPTAAATGDLVYRLIHHFGGTITREIAEPLYTALVTDTGSFKYSNTDVHTHRVAAEFMDLGVEPYEVYTRIYERAPLSRLKLLGEALSRLRAEPEHGLAWTVLSHAAYGVAGATEEDSEGVIDQVRTLECAETAVLFKEAQPGVVKVSFRSKGKVDVNAVAKRFGGGGHVRAAGLTMEAPLSEVIEKVLAAVRQA